MNDLYSHQLPQRHNLLLIGNKFNKQAGFIFVLKGILVIIEN
jgi:hypothetical protein